MVESSRKKIFISSPPVVKRVIIDRTSPQKIVPHGFYPDSKSGQSLHDHRQNQSSKNNMITSFNDSFHIVNTQESEQSPNRAVTSGMIKNLNLENQTSSQQYCMNQTAKQPMTSDLPKLNQF